MSKTRINKWVVFGRVVGDPKFNKVTDRNIPLLTFSIAFETGRPDWTHYANMTMWEKMAEQWKDKLVVGSEWVFTSETRQDRWEDSSGKRNTYKWTTSQVQTLEEYEGYSSADPQQKCDGKLIEDEPEQVTPVDGQGREEIPF